MIAAVVLLQAAVLALGGGAVLWLTRADLSHRVYDAALEENERNLQRFHLELARTVSAPFEFTSPEWEKVQNLVESFKLPGGAHIFLLDGRDHVLCHPAIRRNAGLRRVDYHDQPITLLDHTGVVTLGNIDPRTTTVGLTDFLSGPVVLGIEPDPKLGVKIVIDQPEGVMLAAGRRMTEGVVLWGSLAAFGVLLVAALGSHALVRRYDGVLERVNRVLEREVLRRTRRGLAIRNALIFGLAKLADYRDTDTGRHLERIYRYCEVLANDLRSTHPFIDAHWIGLLKLASSMHDIGKVGIPDAILLKPGALNPRERSIMERHAVIGAETLMAVRARVGDDELIDMSVRVAMEHHERWDGTGYPHGLGGENISLAARIVACADVYDALTSHRVYKKAMDHSQAREVILTSRGTHFDPAIVEAFERRGADFDAIRREFVSSDDIERPTLAHIVEQAQLAAA